MPLEIVQNAVQANKDHQYALKVYTERLEAELENISRLLTAADVSEHEDEIEIDTGGAVVIPASVKALGPVSSSDLLSEGSPFLDDAMKRERYVQPITVHQWKAQELEALADAVRLENYRIYALEAQLRGRHTFNVQGGHPSDHLERNKTGIDWTRVALKVSESSNVQRSPRECEIRWLGDRHPDFNHSTWTQSEIDRVKELVADATEGQVDWVQIAAELGTGRTPVDCMRHAILRRSHSWNFEADNRLSQAVRIYGTDNWSVVARYVSEDATPSQCQNRWSRTLDPDLKRGPWTEDEDNALRRAVDILGNAWSEVAMFVPCRSNEQCRERYQDYLNPTVTRGRWTEEEDNALFKLVQESGKVSWKEISKRLGTKRTDNMCRSRFITLSKRKQTEDAAAADPSSSGALATPEPAQVERFSASPAADSAPTPKPKPRPRPRPRARHKSAQAKGEASSSSTPTAVSASAHDRTESTLAHEAGEIQVEPEPTAIKKPSRGRAPKRRPPADTNEKPPAKRRKKTAPEDVGEAGAAASAGVGVIDVAEVRDTHDNLESDQPTDEHHAEQPVGKAKTTKRTRKVRQAPQKQPRNVRVRNAPAQDAMPVDDVGQSVSGNTSTAPADGHDIPKEQPSARRGRKKLPVVESRRQSTRLAARQTLPEDTDLSLQASPPSESLIPGILVAPTTSISTTTGLVETIEAKPQEIGDTSNVLREVPASHADAGYESSELSSPPSSP